MSKPVSDASIERYRQRPETVVTDRGEGHPVVFAHGTLMDRTMFDPQIDALADNYRTIAYDLRARTDRYVGPYDLYDLADDAVALADGLALDSFVLCGMSMGGFMALRFAEHYPERLEGIVLIDAIAEPHTEEEREQYGQLTDGVREAGEFSDTVLDIARNELFGATTLANNSELVDQWVDRWRTYPPESFYHEMYSWLDRSDFTDTLSEIDLPVLSIHGEEDSSLKPERTESMLEALPDTRQELIPEAGHSSNLENPKPVNDALRAFLDGIY